MPSTQGRTEASRLRGIDTETRIRTILKKAGIGPVRIKNFVEALQLQEVMPHNPFDLYDFTAGSESENRHRVVQLCEALETLGRFDENFLTEALIWHTPDSIDSDLVTLMKPQLFQTLATSIRSSLPSNQTKKGRPTDTAISSHVSWVVHLWVNMLRQKPYSSRSSRLYQLIATWLPSIGYGRADYRPYIRKSLSELSLRKIRPPRKG